MPKKSLTTSLIEAEEAMLEEVIADLPENPIPWGPVIRLVAPLIARIAMRRALKKVGRGLSQDKINTISENVSALVRRSLEKRT